MQSLLSFLQVTTILLLLVGAWQQQRTIHNLLQVIARQQEVNLEQQHFNEKVNRTLESNNQTIHILLENQRNLASLKMNH